MQRSLWRFFSLCSAVLLIFFGVARASAAQSSANATLTGTITDPHGAAIGGAQISVEPTVADHADSAATQRVNSTDDGQFRVALAPGRYRITITRDSFSRIEQGITVTAGETRALEIHMALEPLSASVTVTAQAVPLDVSSTPAPVTILTRQEITDRQATSLPDLLATQTGVSIARTGTIGGVASIFIDGGGSNFAKVLVDGTPVNEPGGTIDFSNFTLDNVDKIEVVHGAESALYGTDAMSGVIQVVSHRGTTREPAVDIFAEGGGFSSARGGAQVSGLLGAFDYSAAGSYFQTAGQGADDAFLNRGFAGNFGYRFSDSDQLRLTVRSNSSFAGTPGQVAYASIDPFAVDDTAYADLKQLSTNLTWSFSTGSHWTHRISGMESRIVDTNAFPDFDFFGTDEFNRAGFLEQSTYSFRQGAATAGYQYEVENAFPNSLGGMHARRNNQAGFLDAHWQPLSRLTVSGGVRAEDNTNFGTRVVPRAGVAYALRQSQNLWGDTRLRFSYGEGIEEPTVFESFSTDPCNPGNPSLRPEQSTTFNGGVDQYFRANRFRVSVSFFSNDYRDLINQIVGPANASCFTGTEMLLFNTDLSRARGVNWSGEARVLRWLSLKANYAFDDTRVLKTVPDAPDVEQPGNHLLRRPVNSGNVWLDARVRRADLNLAAYFSGQRTDSDFDGLGFTRNPGYARFDVATHYDVTSDISIYGHVANLFNKQYQEALGYPALGRDYRVGVNYRFGGKE